MSHSYSIGDVRVKGDIIDKVFENTVNISCDSLFQNDVLIKHGLIFRFCPVPLAADYLYELWHYPHSFNIEKLISEHIFYCNKLFEKRNSPFISSESLIEVIQKCEDEEVIYYSMKKSIEPIQAPLSVGYFSSESKTVVSLFTILKQSGIFEHIAHQFLFGNLIYGRCFQMYLDQFYHLTPL